MAIQSNLVSAASLPLSQTTDVKVPPTVSSSLVTAPNFNTIIDVLSHVRPGTTVILDVDNTLYYPEDDEFCMKYSFERDPRVGNQYQRFFNDVLVPRYGEEKAQELFHKALHSTWSKLTNPMWPELLKQLAVQGVTVIRLTALVGDKKIGNTTSADLRIKTEKSLGLDFESLFFYPKDPIFSPRTSAKNEPVTVMAKAGEIFCSRCSKDEVLSEYWSQVGYPEAAVVVDDQKANVVKILNMCRGKKVACTGVYYTELAVTFPGTFDEELAALKFDILDNEGVWVADSDARRCLPLRFPSPLDNELVSFQSQVLSAEEIELLNYWAMEPVPLQEEDQVPCFCCTLL